MTEVCPVCKMKVELTKVEDYSDYKKRYYSCGDIVKSVSKWRTIRIKAKRDEDYNLR